MLLSGDTRIIFSPMPSLAIPMGTTACCLKAWIGALSYCTSAKTFAHLTYQTCLASLTLLASALQHPWKKLSLSEQLVNLWCK